MSMFSWRQSTAEVSPPPIPFRIQRLYRLHYHEERTIEILRGLVEWKECRTLTEVIERAQRPDVSAEDIILKYLQDSQNTYDLSLADIISGLEHHVKREAVRRQIRILREIAELPILLKIPLPPPIIATFLYPALLGPTGIDVEPAKVSVVAVDRHRLPVEFDCIHLPTIRDSREARARLKETHMLVVELAKPNGCWNGNETAGDLLDHRLIGPKCRVAVHKRPRLHRDDSPIDPAMDRRLVLL